MNPANTQKPILIVVIALLAVTYATGISSASGERSPEYHVKAAFIYNFAQFVEWPQEWVGSKPASLTVGVYGIDPFGVVLDELEGAEVNNRRVHVVRFGTIAELESCDILFVASCDRAEIQEVLRRTNNTPTLTVGDDADFTHMGGMIRFFIAERKVRFEVNLADVRAAGLVISSRLLRVAQIAQPPNHADGDAR